MGGAVCCGVVVGDGLLVELTPVGDGETAVLVADPDVDLGALPVTLDERPVGPDGAADELDRVALDDTGTGEGFVPPPVDDPPPASDAGRTT